MRWKKWTALTVSSVMTASLIAGCGDAKETAGGANGAAGNKESETSQNVNKAGMPIVKQPIELTFFTGLAATNGSNKFEERLVWKEYAKMSNVKVNFQTVPFENLTEKRNLALANGDYPDVLYSARVPASDLMKYGSQGVFVKLNDYIDSYAPNLKKLMDKYPDLRKALTMPDGNIYSFPSFYSPEFLPMLIGTPLWVKKDWLDKLNMKEPQTIDDLYAYLKAVKTTDLNGKRTSRRNSLQRHGNQPAHGADHGSMGRWNARSRT